MTAPPKGRQRAERNRTKLYARIKHLMLIFTSISVNKNNSFYNSEGQKNIYSIKTNKNRTKVYIYIKQSMLLFNKEVSMHLVHNAGNITNIHKFLLYLK